LGWAGGRASDFGLALDAGRCCGGADVVEVTTAGRDVVVVGVAWEEDDADVLVDVLVDVLGAAGFAAGAGSGPSLLGDLTGGRSGPDPCAAVGALPSPSIASAAAMSMSTKRGPLDPAPPNCRSR
jgi:hypothetical protein